MGAGIEVEVMYIQYVTSSTTQSESMTSTMPKGQFRAPDSTQLN